MVDVKVRAGWAILCVRNGGDIVRAEKLKGSFEERRRI